MTIPEVIRMNSVTYTQVQELVAHLPVTKLPRAFAMLKSLVNEEAITPSVQIKILNLPLAERRRLLAKQAEELLAHYEETVTEREEWQGGDFGDY
jgi:hypothetical protein